ncbi:MAG: hypothetical protein DRH97_04450, partial [Chloroflexi bacterium]
EEIRVQWNKPEDYNFVAGYEIVHDIPDRDSPIRVGKNRRSISFNKVDDGFHSFGVRTIATDGDRSKYKMTSIVVDDPFDANVPRIASGLAKGVFCTSNAFMANDPGLIDNILTFEDSSFAMSPIQDDSITYSSEFAVEATWKIDVDGIPVQTIQNPTKLENLLETFWVLFDQSGANPTDDAPFKLIEWDFLSLKDLYFWKDESGTTFTSPGGTVTIPARSNIMTGSGTSFLTDLSLGTVLKLGGASLGAKGAHVVSIISDTEAIIDRSFNQAVTAFTYQIPALDLDLENDAVVGSVRKPYGSTIVEFVSYITVDPTLVKTFRQDEEPLPPAKYNLKVGDLWYDTDNNERMHRWDGTDWINVMSKGQATGYFQPNSGPTQSNPYLLRNTDIWFDTANDDNQHRWNEGTNDWDDIENSPWTLGLLGGNDIAARADGITHFLLQDELPLETDLINYGLGDRFGEGDIWVDTGAANASWRWDNTGNVWVSSKTNATSQVVYTQSSEPTTGSLLEGDIWFDTDEDNKQRVFRQGAWELVSSNVGAVQTPIFMVFTGQSNATASDLATASGMTTNSAVYDWTNGGVGSVFDWEVVNPNASERADFVSSVLYTGMRLGGVGNIGWAAADRIQRETGRTVYMLTTHRGGAPIAEWLGIEALKVELDDQITDALASTELTTAGITKADIVIWMQGESDAIQNDDGYIANLNEVISNADGNGWHVEDHTRWFFCELSYAHVTTQSRNASFHIYDNTSTEYYRVVSSRGRATLDNVHYTGAALIDIGETAGLAASVLPAAKTVQRTAGNITFGAHAKQRDIAETNKDLSTVTIHNVNDQHIRLINDDADTIWDIGMSAGADENLIIDTAGAGALWIGALASITPATGRLRCYSIEQVGGGFGALTSDFLRVLDDIDVVTNEWWFQTDSGNLNITQNTGAGLLGIGGVFSVDPATGIVAIASGDIDNPGIAFDAQSNTGLYYTANAMRITTAGFNVFTMSALANVSEANLSVGGNQLSNVLNPSAGNHVGDMDFNDGRYYRPNTILKASNGSYSVPSISFTNDPDTGMFTSGTNNLQFASGGNLVLSVSALAVQPSALLDMNNLRIQNVLNPTAADHVGDRGYNDLRYLPIAGNTTSQLRLKSLGVGTTASSTTGHIRATNNIIAYYSDE